MSASPVTQPAARPDTQSTGVTRYPITASPVTPPAARPETQNTGVTRYPMSASPSQDGHAAWQSRTAASLSTSIPAAASAVAPLSILSSLWPSTKSSLAYRPATPDASKVPCSPASSRAGPTAPGPGAKSLAGPGAEALEVSSKAGAKASTPAAEGEAVNGRNHFDWVAGDGLDRNLAIGHAMLEARVVQKGATMTVFNSGVLGACADRALAAIMAKNLQTQDRKALLFPALSATTVQRKWKAMLAIAQEHFAAQGKKKKHANGVGVTGFDPRAAQLLQEIADKDDAANTLLQKQEAEATQRQEYVRKRRHNALKRVTDRAPMPKKSRRKHDSEEDDNAVGSDPGDPEQSPTKQEEPEPRKKTPRNPADLMAQTMDKLVKALAAETESVCGGKGANSLHDTDQAKTELALVQARTRELELQLELEKLKRAA